MPQLTPRRLSGIFPPLSTFFTQADEIDTETIRLAIDTLISRDVDGFYVLGSSSEFFYLSDAERRQVAARARDAIPGSKPMILCVSSPSTKQAREFVAYGLDLGVDAFAAVLPEYFPLGYREVRQYYRDLKAACDEVPLLAYNFHEIVPSTADLTVKLVADLAETGAIQGLKESSFDWTGHALPVLDGLAGLEVREDFAFMAGTERVLLASSESPYPVDGAIISGAHVFPRLYADALEMPAQSDEKRDQIRACLDSIARLFAIGGAANVPGLMKEFLVATGIPVPTRVRAPLPPLKKRLQRKIPPILATLADAGYFSPSG